MNKEDKLCVVIVLCMLCTGTLLAIYGILTPVEKTEIIVSRDINFYFDKPTEINIKNQVYKVVRICKDNDSVELYTTSSEPKIFSINSSVSIIFKNRADVEVGYWELDSLSNVERIDFYGDGCCILYDEINPVIVICALVIMISSIAVPFLMIALD